MVLTGTLTGMALLTMDQRGEGPDVVWLHGFTQTRATAEPFLSILAGNHRIMTPDLPGHGGSASIAASLDETASLVQAQRPLASTALGGYSFGGRVALHVALAHPETVQRLVLVSTSMGIADEEERELRRQQDAALASRIRAIGAAAFLEEWRSLPLFATTPRTSWGDRSTDSEGLARSLETAGVGTQAYLGPQLSALTMPVLVVYGSLDDKYAAAASAMADLLPNASVVAMAGAGHAVHLEQPERVAATVSEFLLSA